MPFQELPSLPLLHLILLPALFPRIPSGNGKKLQKKLVIFVISLRGSIGVSKIQDSVQEQLKILHAELGKGKSSSKAQAALDELHYLTTFNQNVSFAVGKSLHPNG